MKNSLNYLSDFFFAPLRLCASALKFDWFNAKAQSHKGAEEEKTDEAVMGESARPGSAGASPHHENLKYLWLGLGLGIVGWGSVADAQTAITPQAIRRLGDKAYQLPQSTPIATTLLFDHESKEFDAAHGETVAPFTFKLTNVGSNEIIVTSVQTSCACTTAHLPTLPWHIPAGTSNEFEVDVDLRNKMGQIVKTVTFNTTAGSKRLMLKVNITPAPPPGELTTADRQAAFAKSAADPRAIFRADCVSCHVEKGRGLAGEDLYAADCAICHESSHRASAVPDLHALKQATNLDYWKAVITYGKPHTMMPGWAQEQGGPLTEAQIASLAAYLDRTISHHF